MPRISTEDIQEAVNKIRKDPITGEYKIELERSERQEFKRRAVSITKDLNLDNDEHRISEHGVLELVRNILTKVGEISEKSDEKTDLKEEFQKQKQKTFSETLGNPPTEYHIVFPLNIQVLGSMPDKINLGETTLERINYERWNKDYLQPALRNEDSNFESFYEENPNDPDRFSWSYWKVSYSARDAWYAMYEVHDTLQLMMAEINFLGNQWIRTMPRPAGSGRAPRDRWSHLQMPFVLLSFHDQDFERYYALDYDYRGGLADRTFMPRIESFDSLPGLYRHRRDLDDVENLIANTLVVFQDGITEPVFRRSFFDFWRGIERLAGEDGLDNEDIVNRATFALKFMMDLENGLLPETEEAISELATTRNKLTHEWPEARISERHRDAAKCLLDGLLTLYLEHREEYDKDDFRYLLKFGAMTQSGDEIEKIMEALDRLEVLD